MRYEYLILHNLYSRINSEEYYAPEKSSDAAIPSSCLTIKCSASGTSGKLGNAAAELDLRARRLPMAADVKGRPLRAAKAKCCWPGVAPLSTCRPCLSTDSLRALKMNGDRQCRKHAEEEASEGA